MTPTKIESVVNQVRTDLQQRSSRARPKRMCTERCMRALSELELLNHALHLCDGIDQMLSGNFSKGKAGRHLGSLQTICSFLGLYSLDEMREMNRP